MDCYLLSLYVSLEQELAIRELFVYNRWDFNKYEGSSFSYESKQITDSAFSEKKQTAVSADPVSGKRDTSVKNSEIDASEESQIFSDLQHFVEATLIAVSTDTIKFESTQNESVPSDRESQIQVINNAVQGTSRVDESYKADHSENNIETSAKVERFNYSRVGNSDNDIDELFYEETSDPEMIDGYEREKGITIGKSFKESRKTADINHSVTLHSDDDVNISKSLENRDVNPCYIDSVLDPDSERNNTAETVSKGVLRVTDELNSDENKSKNKDVRESKKRKCQTLAKDKKKRKLEKRENTENDDIIEGKSSRRKKAKVGEFYCKECKNTFRLLGAYKNHKRDGRCLFECEYCGKLFTARYYSNYKAHLKYHLKERPHKCHVCGKSYIEAQTLKIHMRKHSGDRPYVCHQCGLRFYSSSHLLSHRNSAHNDTRQIHTCDICDANLSTLGNLRVHKRVVHAVERPFTCEICGKSFKTQKSLEQVHAKVHTEDFPYKCNFSKCGKMFKRAEGLTDHMRRHNNERNHFCEKCGKGFYTNKDLILHIRTHTGEKPHQCQLCDYKCALSGNLRKHMKTHQLPRTSDLLNNNVTSSNFVQQIS